MVVSTNGPQSLFLFFFNRTFIHEVGKSRITIQDSHDEIFPSSQRKLEGFMSQKMSDLIGRTMHMRDRNKMIIEI